MYKSSKGLIYIILGSVLVIAFGGEFLLRAAVVLFGFFLIYTGLQLRNAQRILFFMNRFRGRF